MRNSLCAEDMHLRIDECRGQCYDGASAMSGVKSGVATRIKTLNSKILYTRWGLFKYYVTQNLPF